MKNILVFAAMGEVLTGIALILAPSLVVNLLFGEELLGTALPVARYAGIALTSFAIACWPGTPLLGMLLYSSAVVLYLAYLGAFAGLTGIVLWPAVTIHVVLSFFLGRALLAEA